jgi:hypothetical protein
MASNTNNNGYRGRAMTRAATNDIVVDDFHGSPYAVITTTTIV